MSKIYKNDIGTIITVNCGTDISLATVKKLLIKKPNGTLVEWDGVLHETNYLRYTIVTNDLDQVGIWYLQAYIEMPNWKGKGETTSFSVYDNYT